MEANKGSSSPNLEIGGGQDVRRPADGYDGPREASPAEREEGPGVHGDGRGAVGSQLDVGVQDEGAAQLREIRIR
ncbi:hypothetical protein CEXT_601931 [Caerostris extrusa]|uniref:Uncharacterized protein n=1 Tax=Caerostris extrusa TaxID=172846 RepID=A0AAV4NKK4_CAEEX|nr:hypothetical protein CEXT_601931 [Caerostris extrusa]